VIGLIDIFYSIPGWLATFLLAMSPVFELRGAIPLAIGVYGIPPLEAYAISVVVLLSSSSWSRSPSG